MKLGMQRRTRTPHAAPVRLAARMAFRAESHAEAPGVVGSAEGIHVSFGSLTALFAGIKTIHDAGVAFRAELEHAPLLMAVKDFFPFICLNFAETALSYITLFPT